MQYTIVKEKYPVYFEEIKKEDLKLQNIDEIVDYFKKKIEEDEIAKLIGVFDHYNHTKNINGQIAEAVKNAKMVVFCFGSSISAPLALALKPRNIGITEMEDKFVFSFLEAPKEGPNKKMTSWIEGLK